MGLASYQVTTEEQEGRCTAKKIAASEKRGRKERKQIFYNL
jgi:hypothetical protein